MAMAANLESMEKNDQALSIYQQIASIYPNSFQCPAGAAFTSSTFESENRIEEARRICETILTRYRRVFGPAKRRRNCACLKPNASSQAPSAQTIPPFLTAPSQRQRPRYLRTVRSRDRCCRGGRVASTCEMAAGRAAIGANR